mmetsp:Transcript_18597/g.43316  ORF Transcript_18597/g.43316 Transcript_18597/m.43316 type:complete len:469 (-) Transcript_18597:199-1605(-)
MDDRFFTMSLGTVGPSTIDNKANTLNLGAGGRRINRTDDIDGAQPTYKSQEFMNKRQFYDPSDIKGARSNTLHRQTNVRDNTMRVDDIDGAVPTPYTFVTKREVDPLVPKYKLPSYQPAPDAPPKFVRDSYNVSDIAGTKPKPLFRFQQRNSTVNDIEGAQPGWKPRHQRVRHESNPITHQFNVRDITDTGFKSTRVTDPLRPQYTVNGMYVTDDFEKTMPKKLPSAAQHDYFNLQTSDIEGAVSGWKPPHAMQPPMEKRRQFRNTNFIGDIAGAQPDTVVHAIRTDRVTNPLQPVYQSLDGEVLGPPMDALDLTSPPVEAAQTQMQRPETDVPPMMMATQRMGDAMPTSGEDKDALIATLENELQSLRAPTGPSPRINEGGTRDIQPAQPPRGFVPPVSSRGGVSGANDQGAAKTTAAAPSRGGSRGATADRMVLKSSSGAPRVAPTPRDRREMAQTQSDIDAVRGL